tara:strand:+ start:79685 stop:80686 length:1002 start_codon:yes stop_codon:yes gene_type:complete
MDRSLSDRLPPRFVVTIDTEEEGLWSGNYAAQGEVTNIRGVPRFQDLCDRFQIRPTYLVDTPVLQSDEATDILRPIQDTGRAEIGAHLHPWNTPPLSEERTPRNSYLCNLPVQLQRAKLQTLTEQIESRYGRRPTSFRAGRYGLDAEGAKILADLGYLVDSSVLPYANYQPESGPDFRHAPLTPYHVGTVDLLQPMLPHEEMPHALLEVPVTAGFTHRWFEVASRLHRAAHVQPLRGMRAVGVLDRLGIATKVKLSPEQASAGQMKKLIHACLDRTHPVLVLMFHSSSLVPGFSPYVKSEDELNQFLDRLEEVFRFCTQHHFMRASTLSECVN